MTKEKGSKPNYYINKSEMMDELISYNKTGIISENLGAMFLNIAKRYTSKPKFFKYSYRQDMIGEAVYRMCDQVHKFDINHPSANPFSYFTQVAHNQIILLLNREKKIRDSKEMYRNAVWDEVCQEEGLQNNFNKEED